MTYHYMIPGPPITKKNHQMIRVNHKTGRPFVGQSKRYVEYESTASRIYEKSRGYILNAPSTAINWREK